MQTHLQAPAEQSHKQHQAAQQPAQLLADSESAFEDNRPQTAQLKTQQIMMANSPQQQKQQKQQALQAKMNASARIQNMHALQAKMAVSSVAQLVEEEAPLQAESVGETVQREVVAEAPKPNNTGLPDDLKSGIESLSGMSMDHVKVHYNSSQPAQLNAHAYVQGSEIHVAPGQEQHVPHEAWHVVQQAQGRVKPTMQMKAGVPVNDDVGLETEADVMGAKALQMQAWGDVSGREGVTPIRMPVPMTSMVQRKSVTMVATGLTHMVRLMEGSLYRKNFLENEAEQVVEGDQVEIESTSRLQSRRGPNQEQHADIDESGPQWYGWYLASKHKYQPVKAPHTYIREDTIQTGGIADDVDSSEVGTILDDAREEQGRSSNSPVVPKDLSNLPKIGHMSFKHDDMEPACRAAAGYIKKMAEVGVKRGFQVQVRCAEEGKAILKNFMGNDLLFNVLTLVTVAPELVETWAEDSGSFNIMGGVSVPARVKRDDVAEHKVQVYLARARRYYGDSKVDAIKSELSNRTQRNQETFVRDTFPLTDFAGVGKIASEDLGRSKATLATGGNKPLREDMTHQEGGNTLTGTLRNGEPYALVGRDSAEFSRSILAKKYKMTISDELLRACLSADLGMDEKSVFLVEQPGEFHLDMSMVLMGPGQVAINDPHGAATLGAEWIWQSHRRGEPPSPGEPPSEPRTEHSDEDEREPDMDLFAEVPPEREEYLRLHNKYNKACELVSNWNSKARTLESAIQTMKEKAVKEQSYLDLCIKDLHAAGLEVAQMPLVFDLPDIGKMNFANGEGGTGVDGKRFFVTNGGTPEAEQYIRETLGKLYEVEVEFVDRESSALSLEASGGAGCRVKFEGAPKL